MSAGTWQEPQAHLPSELAPHTHTAEFSLSPALSPARSPLKGAREFSPQPRAYSPMHGGETSDSDVPDTSGPRRQSTPTKQGLGPQDSHGKRTGAKKKTKKKGCSPGKSERAVALNKAAQVCLATLAGCPSLRADQSLVRALARPS